MSGGRASSTSCNWLRSGAISVRHLPLRDVGEVKTDGSTAFGGRVGALREECIRACEEIFLPSLLGSFYVATLHHLQMGSESFQCLCQGREHCCRTKSALLPFGFV